MCQFRVICFLVFALFLVACLSVRADSTSCAEEGGTAGSLENAIKAVEEAKKFTNEVFQEAQQVLSSSKGVLERVNALKTKANEAESQATQVLFQANKGAKDNEKAKSLVDNIKNIYKDVTVRHINVKKKLENSITSLDKVVAEADKLNKQCNTVLPSTGTIFKNCTEEKANALLIKNKTDELDGNITEALTIIVGVSSTVAHMEKSAKDAKLKNFQLSGIVAGTELETKIGEADSIIQTINNKKEEVNSIVQEMKKRSTNAPTDLIEFINGLLHRVDGDLRNVISALDNATKVKTDMTREKDVANNALKKVEKETEVIEAHAEVTIVKNSVEKVKKLFPLLNSALEATDASVTNAKVLKQKFQTALSKATTEQNSGEVKETEKSDPQVGQGIGVNQKDAMTKPTTKDSLDQSNHSAEQLKDTLSKVTQNVSKTLLTGEKAPVPGAKNDSAMTVSVPLLVALIASAVLQ